MNQTSTGLHRLAHVLHVANSNPTMPGMFYPIKSAILKTWGTPYGFDRQLIEHPCWDCGGDGGFEDEFCEKCTGTGVYRRVCVRLDRYRFGNRLFHIPAGRIPVVAKEHCQIVGYVKHRRRRTTHLAGIAIGQMFHRPMYLKALERVAPKQFGRTIRRSNQICEWVDAPDWSSLSSVFASLISTEICDRKNRQEVPF